MYSYTFTTNTYLDIILLLLSVCTIIKTGKEMIHTKLRTLMTERRAGHIVKEVHRYLVNLLTLFK